MFARFAMRTAAFKPGLNRALTFGATGSISCGFLVVASNTSASVPAFSLKDPKFDQSTYSGRLMGMFDLIDPRTLFVSDTRLTECQSMLKSFESGDRGEHNDEQLWQARKVVEATIHPATGEKMLVAGRMSAFIPMNVPIAAGMLMHGPTSMGATILWQWINQSYNVVNNYTNRAGASIEWAPLMSSYALAVTASISLALGAGIVMKRNPGLQKLGAFVPYLAVITAGSCNVSFTRMQEMRQGITVFDAAGESLGTSIAAAKLAVFKTVTTRSMFLPIFPLLIPPLTMGLLRNSVLKGSSKGVTIFAELAVIAISLGIGLPCALAILPQQMSLPVNQLESEIQEEAAKRGLVEVYANKGL